MGATHFTGPVITGDLQQGQPGGPNQGFIESYQDITITSAMLGTSAGTTNFLLNVPAGSVIMGFEVIVSQVFNSGGAASLAIGSTPGGTDYTTVADIKAMTPGFATMVQTNAQIAAQRGITIAGVPAPLPGPVYTSITYAGAAPTTGAALVSVHYVQRASTN